MKTRITVVSLIMAFALLLSGCMAVSTEVALSDLENVADNVDEVVFMSSVFGFEIGDDDEDDEFTAMLIEEMIGDSDEASHIIRGGREFIGMDMPIVIANGENIFDEDELGDLTLLAAYDQSEGEGAIALTLWFDGLGDSTDELGLDEFDDFDGIDLDFSITLTNDLAKQVTIFVNTASFDFATREFFTGDIDLESGKSIELNFFSLYTDELAKDGTRLLAVIKK